MQECACVQARVYLFVSTLFPPLWRYKAITELSGDDKAQSSTRKSTYFKRCN